MKIVASIGEVDSEVEILRDGNSLTAVIDGRSYPVDLSEPEPGVCLIKFENRVFEFFVDRRTESGYSVITRNGEFEVNVRDPRSLRGSLGAGGAAAGSSEITTAMPGKVVRILKAEGEDVSTGEGVIVVEAMKMQNELKSPKDGTVKSIAFSEGETVNAGDILAVID